MRRLVAGAVEPSDIAEDLFDKGQFAAWRRGRTRCHCDIPTVLQGLVIDTADHPGRVEVDDIDLLIEDLGFPEGDLLGLAADVIPTPVVEDARALRRPQYLDDLIARRASGVN